jgi:phage head maturation protease
MERGQISEQCATEGRRRAQVGGLCRNSPSQDLGGFVETIAPGAFSRAIRERQEVRCLFNHDTGVILGAPKPEL